MRITQRNTQFNPHEEKPDMASIFIRAKYQLWNQEGRPSADPHGWLCSFLYADRERVGKRPTNWCKFRKVCKAIAGDKKVKIIKEEVWRHLTMYYVHTRRVGPLSDDESDASCGHGWEKPQLRACKKLDFLGK